MPASKELKPWSKFTPQEMAAVEAYCNPESEGYKNQTESYKIAGYYTPQVPEGAVDDGRASRNTRVYASQLFSKPHLKAEVAKRMDKMRSALRMQYDDVLDKFSRIAEFDLSDYLVRAECTCPHCEGDISDRVQEYGFDIEKLKRDGMGQLLKKVKPTRYGTEIEFYDAVDSLDKLMKHYGGYEANKSSQDLSDFDEVITLARKRQKGE